MANKQLVPLELLRLSADPVGTAAGQTYFNITTNKIRVFDGSVWADAGGSAPMQRTFGFFVS